MALVGAVSSDGENELVSSDGEVKLYRIFTVAARAKVDRGSVG